MTTTTDYLLHGALIGAGATALLDLWAVGRQKLQGVAPPDYALVGRWIAHMTHGQFGHKSIANTQPVASERLIGWGAHYAIGMAFAAVVLAIWGVDWAHHPRIGPALIVGICSVGAPFLLMQPGMGLGLAASRTPRPAAARVRSLITHTVFGIGLYVAAWVTSRIN